jgi:hypothetical protein
MGSNQSRSDSNKREIIIPASLTVLTEDSFANPESVTVVKFQAGSQIRRLETATFGRFDSLESICIAASVEFIGKKCFAPSQPVPGCAFRPLQHVTFESGSQLREIEAGAFWDCFSSVEICIPASVERMTAVSLPISRYSRIEIEHGNRFFKKKTDFVMTSNVQRILRYCGSASDVLVPDEVELIDVCCFHGYSCICSVTFGSMSKLISIRESAIGNCIALRTIRIPSSVADLGRYCFGQCASLQTVSFCPGSTLDCAPNRAFILCTKLHSIILPASVKTIGPHCFHVCRDLATSPLPLDSGVVRIEKAAFSMCMSLRSLILPTSVAFIGRNCFEDCHFLTNLTFSSPSRLRELLNLPPELAGLVSIPDSVEIICVHRYSSPWTTPSPKRTLGFGSDSKLKEIKPEFHEVPSLLQLSTPCLKRLRTTLEFERET